MNKENLNQLKETVSTFQFKFELEAKQITDRIIQTEKELIASLSGNNVSENTNIEVAWNNSFINGKLEKLPLENFKKVIGPANKCRVELSPGNVAIKTDWDTSFEAKIKNNEITFQVREFCQNKPKSILTDKDIFYKAEAFLELLSLLSELNQQNKPL